MNGASAPVYGDWHANGYGSPPNSTIMNKDSMPSDKAEAARQKSAAVMEALRNGDQGAADRLMGKNEARKGHASGPGPMKWLKGKFAGKDKGGKEVGDGDSVMSEGVEREQVTVGNNGKKGDRIIR
ncbi:Hypothetical predicted protein [Lecanosticta acicola]|uniref:Uncharacterized protein n=1 Tax=Lecanosticta acicola TaxID=111012 RepID=A0AAI8YSB4_9PEZI|nr:Hypothetical predicted protein [Lecanosticta acicola]